MTSFSAAEGVAASNSLLIQTRSVRGATEFLNVNANDPAGCPRAPLHRRSSAPLRSFEFPHVAHPALDVAGFAKAYGEPCSAIFSTSSLQNLGKEEPLARPPDAAAGLTRLVSPARRAPSAAGPHQVDQRHAAHHDEHPARRAGPRRRKPSTPASTTRPNTASKAPVSMRCGPASSRRCRRWGPGSPGGRARSRRASAARAARPAVLLDVVLHGQAYPGSRRGLRIFGSHWRRGRWTASSWPTAPAAAARCAGRGG